MTLLADGVGRLDSARGIAWVQSSNGARNAVLKSVEGSEFFTTIRMATINNLYTNPLVYRFFGCDIAPQNLHPASYSTRSTATLHAGAAEFSALVEKRRATVLLMVGQTSTRLLLMHRALLSCRSWPTSARRVLSPSLKLLLIIFPS
jgi:hypothetical protein